MRRLARRRRRSTRVLCNERRRRRRRPDRLPPRRRALPLLRQRHQHAQPTSRGSQRARGRRATVVDRSAELGAARAAGPGGRRASLARAHAARPRRAAAASASREATVAGVRALRRRAPATRARTASSCCVDAARRAARSGTRCSAAGAVAAGCPAGLGARDTLRLEAALPLYGTRHRRRRRRRSRPASRWVVKLGEGRLRRPRARSRRRRERGVPRRLVGLELDEPGDPAARLRRVAATDAPVGDGDERHASRRRSARPSGSRTWRRDATRARARALAVEIRGRRVPARVVDAAVLPARRGRRRLSMEFPSDLRYTKEHEWLALEGERRRRRHHRLRAGRARRRRLRRAAGRRDACSRRGRPSASSSRSRRCRDVYAPVARHGRRGQRGAARRARAGERGSVRRGWMIRHRARATPTRSTGLLDAARTARFVASEQAK